MIHKLELERLLEKLESYPMLPPKNHLSVGLLFIQFPQKFSKDRSDQGSNSIK